MKTWIGFRETLCDPFNFHKYSSAENQGWNNWTLLKAYIQTSVNVNVLTSTTCWLVLYAGYLRIAHRGSLGYINFMPTFFFFMFQNIFFFLFGIFRSTTPTINIQCSVFKSTIIVVTWQFQNSIVYHLMFTVINKHCYHLLSCRSGTQVLPKYLAYYFCESLELTWFQICSSIVLISFSLPAQIPKISHLQKKNAYLRIIFVKVHRTHSPISLALGMVT